MNMGSKFVEIASPEFTEECVAKLKSFIKNKIYAPHRLIIADEGFARLANVA